MSSRSSGITCETGDNSGHPVPLGDPAPQPVAHGRRQVGVQRRRAREQQFQRGQVERGTAGAGNDRLFGQDGHDYHFGSAGNDIVRGDDGNDILDGSTGNDALRGGTGEDRADGGPGHNRVNGGPAIDTCLNGPVFEECP